MKGEYDMHAEILLDIIDEMEKKKNKDVQFIQYPITHEKSIITTAVWDRAIGIVRLHILRTDKELQKLEQIVTGGNLLFFDNLVKRRIDKIQTILCSKAKEYATDRDRFHNFKMAARMNGTTPEEALKGMMLKHEVAVLDMIKDTDKATKEMIDEKLGDNINYLILLEGLLKERLL